MRSKTNNYETNVLGEEPLWSDVSGLTSDQISSRLCKAYNWYNYFCDDEQYKKFTIEYCKKNIDKNSVEKIKLLPKTNPLFRCLGSSARILFLGGKLPEKELSLFEANLNLLLDETKNFLTSEESEQVVTRQNVQYYIKEKISSTICNLNCKIDEFICTDDYKSFLKNFNIETWIKEHNLKPYECSAIHDYYSSSLSEKRCVLESPEQNKDLVEAYSYMNRVKLKKLVEMLTMIVDISGQYALQKKERKQRKKKKKTSEQLVRSMKYLGKDDDLSVASVDPRSIIGASMVVLYNTKYNKVTIVQSDTLDGLSVKGTTIINTSKICTKSVRKPKEFLKSLGVSARGIRNQFDALSTKEYEGVSRVNENTLILRTIK